MVFQAEELTDRLILYRKMLMGKERSMSKMNCCSLKMSYSGFERWYPVAVLSDKPALSVRIPIPKLPGLFWPPVRTRYKIITAGSHLNMGPNWELSVNNRTLSHAPNQDLIRRGGTKKPKSQRKKTESQRVTPYNSISLVQEENFLLKYWRIKFSCSLAWLPSCCFWGSTLIEFLAYTTG